MSAAAPETPQPTLAELLREAALHEEQGSHAELAQACQRILSLRPDLAEVHAALGIARRRLGFSEASREALRRAVELRPELTDSWLELGLAEREAGNLEEALHCIGTAARSPGNLDALCHLADTLLLLGRNHAAIQAYHVVLALAPSHATALVNLGAAHLAVGSYADAEQLSRRALEISPASPRALANLASALAELDQPAEALHVQRRALELAPDNPELLCNLGHVLIKLDRLDEALACYRRAQVLAPTMAEAVYGEGLVWLRQGNFEEGWKRYEARVNARTPIPHRSFAEPALQPGENLRERTLLLHADQGLGDDVQFIRFIPALQQRGARLIVELPATLLRLMRQSYPGVTFLPEGAPLGSFDVQCLVMSLPHVLGLRTARDSAPVGYLKADPQRIEHWRKQLAGLPGPRLGIVWAGSSKNLMDSRRSMPLATMRAALDGFAGTLVSLQKECPPTDEADRAAWTELHEVLPPDADFAETAAIIGALDLVIAVDTSMAHLAGALGKPTWTLLAHCPDWRWLRQVETTDWYPTMRLFRQQHPGNWVTVMEKVRRELWKFRPSEQAHV